MGALAELRPVRWLLPLLFVACAKMVPSPADVAERFWEAVRVSDVEAAESLARDPGRGLVKELYGQGSIRDVLLGETLKNESTAIVRTSMTVTSEAGEILITLNTHLVREQGGWQVDVRETKAELARAVWAGGMRQLGEALGESLHEFKAALERGVDQMREALREALEEIQQELK